MLIKRELPKESKIMPQGFPEGMTLLFGVSPDSLWFFSMSEGMKPTKRFTEPFKRLGLLAIHRESVNRISLKTERRSL